MPKNLLSMEEPVRTETPALTEFNDPGLQLSELTTDVAKQLGMENVTGLVITGVRVGSSADTAGLKDGMVISKVGQTAVNSLADFAQSSVGSGRTFSMTSSTSTRNCRSP